MATLDSFREAAGEPIQLDLANGYIADIRLNAGDINGRTITVELTDNGTPITDTTGITVALAYNTTPGSGLGDRVSMPAVFGIPTATYRVAVPRKALQHAGAILMGIEVSVNGTRTCSRNFHGIVERAVFDATAPDAQDQMNVLEQLIDDANKAVRNAVSAAGEAKDAAMNLLDKLRECDGIFCPNESSAVGMLLALRQTNLAGRKAFVGFDASATLVEGLRKGEIQALVSQNPTRMGAEGVRAMVRHLAGETVPPRLDTGVELITAANLDDPAIRPLVEAR